MPTPQIAPPATNEPRPSALDPRASRWLTLLCLLPLCFIVAFRGDTPDTSNYIEAFNVSQALQINPLSYYENVGMEWTFGLASWLLHTFSLPVSTLFFTYSFFTFYFISIAAARLDLTPAEVIPYYLGNYFILQQLMQIRQGLVMAIAFAMLPLFIGRKRTLWTPAGLLTSILVHSSGALTVIATTTIGLLIPKPQKRNVIVWCIQLIAITFICARLIMSLDILSTLGRLSEYTLDGQYNVDRGFFASANIRATLLLTVMLLTLRQPLLQSRLYITMLGMYAVHLGIRFGFYDFLILSGRLSTTLGFSEIFIIPLLVRTHFRSNFTRTLIAVIYFLLHAFATLQTQVPTLIDDYFTNV